MRFVPSRAHVRTRACPGGPPLRDELVAGARHDHALEELLPLALKSLRAHLGDGDPTAWRAAFRVFEHAYGRPDSLPNPELDGDTRIDVRKLSSAQRAALMARV
jgi:hypothetical protein